MKNIIKILAILAGISVAVCVISVIFYMTRNKAGVGELLDLGQSYLEDGKYEQAVASLEAILTIDPKEAKTEKERRILEDKDTIIDQLADAYLAWADEENKDGNGDRAEEIRKAGFEKTGDARLAVLALEENDVYNYMWNWTDMVDDFGLTKAEALSFDNTWTRTGENTYVNENKFGVSWATDEDGNVAGFTVDNHDDLSIPFLNIRIGDSKDEVEEKTGIIEANYNAWGNHYDYGKQECDEYFVLMRNDFHNDYLDYYLLGIDFEGDTVSRMYLTSSVERGDLDCQYAVVDAQEKYGKISRNSWAGKYIDYIAEREMELIAPNGWQYVLVDINDDDVPELYLKGVDIPLQGDKIATFDGSVVKDCDLGYAGGMYIEKRNLLLDSYATTDGYGYYDTVYSIKKGEFIEVAEGNYFNSDENSEYQHYWNEEKVSEKEYDRYLAQTFDEQKAKSILDLQLDDYLRIIEELVEMGNNVPDGSKSRNAGILLREGEVKKIDLNGGVEEEISCQYYAINNETGQLDIFVNDENVFHKTQSGEFGAPLSGSIQVIDANIKDPYKEIYYLFTGEDDEIMGMGFLRYNEKGKIKEYAMNMDDWDGEFIHSWDKTVQSDGAGVLYFNMDTPFRNNTFGNYLVEVKGRLDSKGFRIEDEQTYSIIDDYMKYYDDEMYELNTDAVLYEDFGRKQEISRLPIGTKFRAVAIHPAKSELIRNEFYEFYEFDLYVQAETADGQRGWLFFPRNSRTYDENDILVYTYGWG